MPVPVVFLGTPPAAVTVLDALVEHGHEVVLVVSRADARRGRGGATSPSPVKARAMELGIPVTDSLEDLRDRQFPRGVVGVVVAYGRIIPVDILSIMPMVNVHFSLLPRWRGAAPVERAILAGDAETGVCIMEMEEGLDTGGVYARESTPIDDEVTSQELTSRLAGIGARLMCGVLAKGLGAPEPQPAGHSYARKISAEDALIDWTEPTTTVRRRVRAVTAHTFVNGKRLKVLATATVDEAPQGALRSPGTMDHHANVATGDGIVRLITVQPEGKQPMPAADWVRGVQTGFPVQLG